jgi:cobalt-zinc-cadmium efflux system protein
MCLDMDHMHPHSNHEGHAHAGRGHAGHHDHGRARAPERALRIVLALTATLTLAEALGGWLTRSLALLSDAAHMLTDTAALAIALVALYLGKRSADARRTFGYARFEILAAAFNAAILIIAAVYIFVVAVQRLREPAVIDTTPMMLLAALALVVNLIAMRLLRHGSQHSLNLKGAYLEVWSDMLGSIGVLVAGAVIAWTSWMPIDPIVAVAISLWILPRVAGIHDLHVWSVSSGQVLLTAHIERDAAAMESDSQTLTTVRTLITQRFGISHATLQLEHVVCASTDCVLTDPASHGHDPA